MVIHLYLPDKLDTLRYAGIRGAIEFSKLQENPELLSKLASDLGIEEDKLKNAVKELRADPHTKLLQHMW